MQVEETEHVEALLRRVRTTRLWVWLPDELATRYRVHRNTTERGQQLLAVLCGVAFFDVFLLSDADLIPDVATLSAWTRVLVITPLGLLFVPVAHWALRRDPATRLHHIYAVGVGVSMVAWVCALQLLTEAPTGVTYFLGAFAIVTYFFCALRTSLAVTASALLSSGLVFVAAMTQESVMVEVIRRDAAITMVVFVLFGLLVAHRDDSTSRRLFVSGQHTDVLEARRELQLGRLATQNERLARDATIDALTGVPNRRALDTATQSWHDQVAGLRGVLIIDLDHFKAYNDGLGHAAGDRCLQRVAAAMSDSLRQVDSLLTRYGGEEFVVLLEHVQLDEAWIVAERLRAAVQDLQIQAPGGSVVTVSVGGAWSSRRDLAGVNELIAAADEALYSAKRSGRNAVAFGAAMAVSSDAPVAS
jgi:diguanylate cyclase (GGDEF)-like protein